MELVNLRLGGGGGASSDDCTAVASQVLTGVTAVTKDSNDEPIQGTMPSQNQMTFANDCWWNASSGLGARMSPAYAAASSGSNPYVYVPPTNVRNTLGITAANIRSGVSIAGVTGTLVDYGASRTVFNNGTFDGVYVTGMSQNYETHAKKYNVTARPLNGNIATAYYSSESWAKPSLIACFNYTLNITPFKTITAKVHNYGSVTLIPFGGGTSKTHMIRGVGKLYLEDASGTVTTIESDTAYYDTGISQSHDTMTYSLNQYRTYTFNVSNYTGKMGLSMSNAEEHITGSGTFFRYLKGFRMDLESFTFNA